MPTKNFLKGKLLPAFLSFVLMAAATAVVFTTDRTETQGMMPPPPMPEERNIDTIEDLYNMRDNLGDKYELTRSLDFCNEEHYRDHTESPGIEDLCETKGANVGWDPIGTAEVDRFEGTFDGGGYTISNLYINRPGEDDVGLFGFVGSGATPIFNIGLEDSNVKGRDRVGVLIGNCQGGSLVNNVYATGDVKGNNKVGGLIGKNVCAVGNSYSSVNVEGENKVGGFVGEMSGGQIDDSYSIGSVTGNTNVGGFAGFNANPGVLQVNDSFYDKDTSGQEDEEENRGTPKTTAEMKTASTFIEADWDIAVVNYGETDIGSPWNIVNPEGTYPFLSWEDPREAPPEPEPEPKPTGGGMPLSFLIAMQEKEKEAPDEEEKEEPPSFFVPTKENLENMIAKAEKKIVLDVEDREGLGSFLLGDRVSDAMVAMIMPQIDREPEVDLFEELWNATLFTDPIKPYAVAGLFENPFRAIVGPNPSFRLVGHPNQKVDAFLFPAENVHKYSVLAENIPLDGEGKSLLNIEEDIPRGVYYVGVRGSHYGEYEQLNKPVTRAEFAGMVAGCVMNKDKTEENKMPFSDVPKDHEHHDAIKYLAQQGIIHGHPDGTFRPDEYINRAEALKVITRSTGVFTETEPEEPTPPFSDTPLDEWYTKYLIAAKDIGIIHGHPDGTFRPGNEIRLGEAMKIIVEASGDLSLPEDQKYVSTHWAKEYLEVLRAKCDFVPHIAETDYRERFGSISKITVVGKYKTPAFEESSFYEGYFEGKTDPLSVVFVTSRSVITGSAVISDAEGKVRVPIEEGTKELVAFVNNPRTGRVGDFMRMMFE